MLEMSLFGKILFCQILSNDHLLKIISKTYCKVVREDTVLTHVFKMKMLSLCYCFEHELVSVLNTSHFTQTIQELKRISSIFEICYNRSNISKRKIIFHPLLVEPIKRLLQLLLAMFVAYWRLRWTS